MGNDLDRRPVDPALAAFLEFVEEGIELDEPGLLPSGLGKTRVDAGVRRETEANQVDERSHTKRA